MVTRTLNPLPFEHLEPKRFEDLSRQLIYDWKMWRMLEATGRSGSDDGFDVRGYEMRATGAESVESEIGDGEAAPDYGQSDRLWLVQCKREKAIGPAKMRSHLAALDQTSLEGLYGLVFVAACDFSKATRDLCREWCRARAIAEVHIWGKAEIEDLLYQPKNDHLLFAYFGISLTVRQRAASTKIRSRTSIKRQLRKALSLDDAGEGAIFILRDPDDDRYPYGDEEENEKKPFQWLEMKAWSLSVDGLSFIWREHDAFVDRSTRQWDIASAINFANVDEYDRLWPTLYEAEDSAIRRASAEFVASLEARHRARWFVCATILYEDILGIDDVGDDFSSYPAVFVKFKGERPITQGEGSAFFRVYDELLNIDAASDAHLSIFPDEFRDTDWENRVFGQMGIVRGQSPLNLEIYRRKAAD